MKRFSVKDVAAWTLIACCTAMLIPRSLRADKGSEIRRFALVASNNSGGPDRVRLRYADSDARSFARVLSELGGMSRSDQLILTDAKRQTLNKAFADLASRLRAASKAEVKLEVLFYYSGHSNENGILLDGDIVLYRELKQLFDSLPAAVRIGVLDSCASGTLVRLKGGRRTAPFLVDDSTRVEGYALLTSASADEAAQESEAVGGSYFTHYLVSGLRGAADANRDGRVTLSESYSYAFDETLRKTELTDAGPQHANYDFRLAGAGDFVLTDLRSTVASLLIPESIDGRVYIRDAQGRLMAEISHTRGRRSLQVGMPPGPYDVTVETGQRVFRGSVRVTAGTPTPLSMSSLSPVARTYTVTRGQSSFVAADSPPSVHRVFAAQLAPGISTNRTEAAVNNVAINLIGVGQDLRGFEFGLLANVRRGRVAGAQAGLFNSAGTLTGAQVGLINVARDTSKGVQIGLLNIADDGIVAPAIWTGDNAAFHLALKSGSKHFYTLFGASAEPGSVFWRSIFAGFGVHADMGRFWFEPDILLHELIDDRTLSYVEPDALAQLRFIFGLRIRESVSIFAGPTFNNLISQRRTGLSSSRNFVAYREDIDNGSLHYELSIGYVFGLQVAPRAAASR